MSPAVNPLVVNLTVASLTSSIKWLTVDQVVVLPLASTRRKLLGTPLLQFTDTISELLLVL